MKLRDLIGILMTKNYEGIEIYDAENVRQERGMLLYARRWDDRDVQELPDALLDREVAAIYGDLDYTRCIDDIFDTPDAVTVIELKGEADGNKSV
jgi:hypothetical protein